MLIMVIILSAATIIFGGLSIWAYTSYQSASNDVNGQIQVAVLEAKAEQQDELEKRFADREKEPNRDFVGPDDYGRVSFKYPKTWSVYVATDPTRGGKYEAYLHPVTVPRISASEQFGLRVTIEDRDYDQVIDSYRSKVNNGDLRSSVTQSEGHEGTRYDGNFTRNIRGSAVVYKVRDKTLTLRTDANTFATDFDSIISTVKFNQ